MSRHGFVWCAHCGDPHGLEARFCEATGKPLDRRLHDVDAEKLLPQTPSGPFRAAAPATPHPLEGVVIGGKYRVIRSIGRGGMGEVFEAENIALGRLVAIKVLVDNRKNEHGFARIEREARLISSIQHPNICDVYDVGRVEPFGPYLVLERLVGETLAARLHRRGRLPIELAVDVFAQVLSGLHAAHEKQIIHRDMKPENVFLVEREGCDPLVKLVDFGFAKDLSGTRESAITRPGRACGTPQYMSPEQLRAQPLDPRSDLFSVGVMMYEALAGEHPFAAESEVEMKVGIIRETPAPLREKRRRVPAELEGVVQRALEKAPGRRAASAMAMQRELLRAVEAMEIDSTPSSTKPMWRLPRLRGSSTPTPAPG